MALAYSTAHKIIVYSSDNGYQGILIVTVVPLLGNLVIRKYFRCEKNATPVARKQSEEYSGKLSENPAPTVTRIIGLWYQVQVSISTYWNHVPVPGTSYAVPVSTHQFIPKGPLWPIHKKSTRQEKGTTFFFRAAMPFLAK